MKAQNRDQLLFGTMCQVPKHYDANICKQELGLHLAMYRQEQVPKRPSHQLILDPQTAFAVGSGLACDTQWHRPG